MWKIIKKILKICFFTFIITVNAALLIRLFTMGDPSSMKVFLWTENMTKQFGDRQNGLEVKKINKKDNINSTGNFSASSVYFIQDEGHIQFTLRYNNSTVKKLSEKYDLKEIPEGELFVFILSDGEKDYTDYVYTSDKKTVYNYRRLVFENVDLSVEKLTLKIYYADDVRLSEPFDTVTVYSTDRMIVPLEKNIWYNEIQAPTEKLYPRAQYIIREEK